MTKELIVDFPTRWNRSSRSVQFAETADMYFVSRQHDCDGVDRHDLWYNNSDYARMRLANKKTALKLRKMIAAGVPLSYSGNDNSRSSGYCLIGIEHLLTPTTASAVAECRERCTEAVLHEQAKQMVRPSVTSGWNAIGFASMAETRKARLRAQKLAELHRQSI